ncbi:hypothetical protein HanPSC8_Chr14g0633171 [Helianthus annuus]|nr:hypothetical protein HanPSC8_Chr14g0633171 [Helianthus annuus]
MMFLMMKFDLLLSERDRWCYQIQSEESNRSLGGVVSRQTVMVVCGGRRRE